ncbi:MAG: hypothetical protein JNK76_21400 [Planctomycetales bacterium]|nr:hypothetical protein [Planctomycetales bacterium]MBN8626318.1 hypothetical protein [Planctomycetota bacterium]
MRWLLPLVVTALLATLSGRCEACDTPDADDPMYAVKVRQAVPKNSKNPDDQRLSPILVATRDGNGILKGVCELTELEPDGPPRMVPLIQIEAGNFAAIKGNDEVVLGVSDKLPKNWQPVSQLMISFHQNDIPNESDLKAMGVKHVETYLPGSYMIVEPINNTIDAQLVKKLVDNKKMTYAAPHVSMKAVP